MSDPFIQFLRRMKESSRYLKMQDLINGYCYKIYARQAYVGVWIHGSKTFLISRYKVGATPYLFHEFHWDTGEPFGTIKPLEIINKFPFEIKDNFECEKAHEICQYLDDLENNNPIIKGVKTADEKRFSAIRFEKKLSGKCNGTALSNEDAST